MRIRAACIVATLLAGCASRSPHPTGGGAGEPARCANENWDLSFLKPLLGVWSEYRIDGSERTPLGTLTTRLTAKGCALQQSFVSPDDTFAFASFGHIDASGLMVETYVLSFGEIATYRWKLGKGELVLERIDGPPDLRKRLRISNITTERYLVIDERSRDGGATWEHFESVEAIRR